MLQILKIRNLAVISEAEIPFRSGLNILSGETGAGKSIVLEAISLLLGGRGSADLIRTGCDEAMVEGLFDVSGLLWMRSRMQRLGYEKNTDELLIRRAVLKSGKHRIHINGELATLSILRELCEGLIDLCGQHEHQSLIRHPVQMELLDRYGGLSGDAEAAAGELAQIRKLEAELIAYRRSDEERARKLDFLRFQRDELREAALTPGEDEVLMLEKKLLQSSEQRLETVEAIKAVLGSDSDEFSVLQSLRLAIQKFRALEQLDPAVTAEVSQALERALAEVEDVHFRLDRYVSGVELDPERAEKIQDRLSLIADFRRKYGASVEEMISTLVSIENELTSLEQSADQIASIEREIHDLESRLNTRARKLSQARRKVARLFSDSVSEELRTLKMEDAEFCIVLTDIEDRSAWTQHGLANEIEFSVRTNRGDLPKPLGKIASGGELSRLMLAIRRVISDRGGIGVYLFDEIDAGMGGQTAFEVGRKLKSVARSNQVICITHLPQVAAFADHHLSVIKQARKDKTETNIVELRPDHRKGEIARMLGGSRLTSTTLKDASELIDSATR